MSRKYDDGPFVEALDRMRRNFFRTFNQEVLATIEQKIRDANAEQDEKRKLEIYREIRVIMAKPLLAVQNASSSLEDLDSCLFERTK